MVREADFFMREDLHFKGQSYYITCFPRFFKGLRAIFLDGTQGIRYNTGRPQTIEHRGAGRPAEIVFFACPLNLIRVMPA